jgi:hypothetical protein
VLIGFLFRCDDCFTQAKIGGSNLNDATKELCRQGWTVKQGLNRAVHLCEKCKRKGAAA